VKKPLRKLLKEKEGKKKLFLLKEILGEPKGKEIYGNIEAVLKRGKDGCSR
jgi:hypothetical protein